ncbi:hypothetical protein QL285_009002 [Trifolium repens]|nr:hypothetical protein QL285_009002 [Trifolium repens]
MASQDDAAIPISSTPVVMLSPPDTQDGPQDVFHTPPEESLLPSSDVDVPPCTVNQAVDLDAGSQAFVELPGFSDSSEFVDFGKDSELGFSNVAQLKNEIAADSVTEKRSNEFRVLEKGVSDLGQCPMKKLKLGFDTLGSCSGVQSQKADDDMGNCDEGKVENADSGREIQMNVNSVADEDVEMQNSVPNENDVETEVVQNAGDVNLIMGNNTNNVIGGTREDLKEATANGSGSGIVRRDEREKKFLVFDVLRMLADHAKEKENETQPLTLLEIAKRAGITFPRPSHWPADRKSDLFKFHDEVEK